MFIKEREEERNREAVIRKGDLEF